MSTNNLQNLTFDENLFGSLLIIVACFFWSMDTTLTKFLSDKRDIFFLTGLKCGIGGMILFTVSSYLGLSFNLQLDMLPILPVSYTHLDVYKRQTFSLEVLPFLALF